LTRFSFKPIGADEISEYKQHICQLQFDPLIILISPSMVNENAKVWLITGKNTYIKRTLSFSYLVQALQVVWVAVLSNQFLREEIS